MLNVGFILVYVDNVAKSEAFYASILGCSAIEFIAHFRDASGGAGSEVGAVAARRRQAGGDVRGRRRDRLSCRRAKRGRSRYSPSGAIKASRSPRPRRRWISATRSSDSTRTASGSGCSPPRRISEIREAGPRTKSARASGAPTSAGMRPV